MGELIQCFAKKPNKICFKNVSVSPFVDIKLAHKRALSTGSHRTDYLGYNIAVLICC